MIWPGAQGTIAETAGLWLIAIAALVRKGIVPFHAWVPGGIQSWTAGAGHLFTAPQLGAYMTVVLIVPRASPDLLRAIAVLALGTAVYGAALALVQTSARRACGYLFMSQSALVMAGLDCTSVSALAGGCSSGCRRGRVCRTRARCVLVLEARRGRLDLTTYHGGYERMPVLAVSFLSMGLAARLARHARVSWDRNCWSRAPSILFPGDGIRRRHCVGTDGTRGRSHVLFALLRAPGSAGARRAAFGLEAARSVDVRRARRCPGRASASRRAARRFAIRGQ